MARLDPSCALVLWDERLSYDDRAANTAASLTSDYTEAELRPGLPVRAGRLLAQVSGTQTADAAVKVSTAYPGVPGRTGVRVLASPDGGTSYLGHLRETDIRRWQMHPDAVGSGSETFGATAAVCTSTGRPIVVYGSDDDTVVSYYDGSTWQSATGDFAGNGYAEEGCAIAVDPITGLLVLVTVDASDNLRTWHSDDDGETWTLISNTDPGLSSTGGGRAALAATRGGLVLLVQRDGTNGDVDQFASSDLGSVWTQVDTASTEGLGWALVVQDGTIFSFSYDASTSAVQMTRTVSPYESILDATEVAIDTSGLTVAGITAWADAAGVLYCVVADGSSSGIFVGLSSTDGGVTWASNGISWASGASNSGPRKLAGAHTPYGAIVACTGESPSNPTQDGSGHVLWLGGWEQIEWAQTTESAFAPGVGIDGTLWLPFSGPAAGDYTVTGAGSATLGANGWALSGEQVATLTDGDAPLHIFEVDAVTGGSLTSLDIGFRVTWSGTELIVRMSTVGFRLYDSVDGSVIDTVATSLAARTQFVVTESALYYRATGDKSWTKVTYTLVSGTPGGSRDTEHAFGNFAGSTSSRWYAAGCSSATYRDGANGARAGKATPCFLPDEVGVPALLTLYDGPGIAGETATVEPRSSYTVEHLDPVLHPSPDVRWRSTTDGPEHVTWDLGDESELGRAVALVVTGASLRQVALEYWSGSAWVTGGTLDLATGLSGLSYTAAGDVLEPASGTSSAGRYIQPGELVGGYLIVSGSPNTTHRIVANGGGVWADGSAMPPWIRVEDATGLGSSGTCAIVAPGGVMLVYASSSVSARYWRVRFPAQDCPDDVLEAGTIWAGRVVVPGAPPDWTWTDDEEPNVQRATSPYGTSRAREIGPTRRTWTWGWADGGTDLYPLRAASASMDFVGPSGGRPMTAAEDVWWTLRDVLRSHQARPVCALRTVPASGTTITDPTLWLYGYLDGSVAARGVVGTEGEDELVRVSSLSIVEQV
jgi:hypothetical protein